MRATAILVATRNEDKMRELRPMFAAAGLSVVDLASLGIEESDEEDGLERFDTFEENALAKAQYFYEVSGGIPTVADDSGLEVQALGGRPGVRSKRFSGHGELSGPSLWAANNRALLDALAGVDDRRARFVCAVAFVSVGDALVRRGEVEGRVLSAPVGDGGFGYDPLFYAPELGRTFGEASIEEKERVSHRGRAFQALVEELRRRR